MTAWLDIVQDLGSAIWLASIAYLLLAFWSVIRFRLPHVEGECGPMSVLKPLCGEEPGLEEDLRSLCEQSYPAPLQIIFGVGSHRDGALPIARRVAAAFDQLDIEIVIDAAEVGPNPKVNNLANMAALAKHPIFVISDSDTRIEAGGLEKLGRAFADSDVGAVTCLYRGTPARPQSRVDRLGALLANGWTLPSHIVAARFGHMDSCLGPLVAIRRAVLEASGGFAALSRFLGDDHELGILTRRQGLRVELGASIVETRAHEASLRELVRHEVRWARTARSQSTLAYAASAVTWSLPLVALSVAIKPSWLGIMAIFAQVILRMGLVASVASRLGCPKELRWAPPWTIAFREALCFCVWAGGFFGDRVAWRGREYRFGRGGVLRPADPIPVGALEAAAAGEPP